MFTPERSKEIPQKHFLGFLVQNLWVGFDKVLGAQMRRTRIMVFLAFFVLDILVPAVTPRYCIIVKSWQSRGDLRLVKFHVDKPIFGHL